MEDEDFGFAKRTDNVLKKVLTISNDTECIDFINIDLLNYY